MIEGLYPKGADRITAAASYAAILLYINTRHQADAQTLMFRLLDFTLQRYNAGRLVGGYSSTTQQQLLAFEMGLYCTVGLPSTGLVLPGVPSDPGTVNKVVLPSSTTQNIVTQNGNAGVQFPGGVLLGPVLVTISPAADNSLHTKLDQYGPLSDVKVSPEASLNGNVSVGICANAPVIPSTVFLAHNISDTNIEVLPRGVDFISGLCGVTTPPAPTGLGTAFNLGRNGDFASATKLVGSTIADMLLPTNANATGGGITGTTKKFSPFGGVDTKVYMTANSPTSQNAPAGSPVGSPPSTIVKTARGVLVANVKVHFSVTSGGGTVAGDSFANVTTGATGVATVSNWVINAGSNTVQAVGTYADPSVTFAQSTDQTFPQNVTVSTDPPGGVTFTATGGDVIPYGSSYSYFSGAYDIGPGFQNTDFTPTGFTTGKAPFGTAGTSTCPIFSDSPLQTSWAINTDLLLRTSFPMPSGWNKPLTISAVIDNDVIIYVNGHPLTIDGDNTLYSFPDNGNYTFDAGFVKHENCATKDELTFTVPASFLVGGQNLLAVRARDRGGVNYIDLKVTAPTP